ncbi:MAG: DNA cytosine methyltransferase [Candidatus Omnitrophota bacterium]|nr:DNA cytosine methyltransferase [Candidatus Omnitrophota bacterium]
MKNNYPFSMGNIKVVDLFCGIGGLTHGLVLEGFNVVAGVDNDESCKYAFEKNNHSKFIHKDIADFSSAELEKIYRGSPIKVLIGCAPCQPFSSLNKNKSAYKTRDNRWEPLYEFIKLIKDVKPDIVSMENVADLANKKKYPVFAKFVRILKAEGYSIFYKIIDVSRYGVPQRRKRLVLLASLLGDISLIQETHNRENLITVRDVIGRLKPIRDGQVDPNDPMHRASKLSDLNKKRILATPKNGGNAKSWSKDLIPDCYKRESGKTFMSSVYGRMRWDEPAPTMTTHCVSLGTGRYGHPTQNRAISLREAAIFQSFPDYYEFNEPDKISTTKVAKQIGNAVPVLLGRVIAKSIRKHIELYQW